MSWKSKVFGPELNMIHGSVSRSVAEYLLERVVPDSFFVIEPSMTQKHHPTCTHRRGGLVIHTKRLIFLAMALADGSKLSSSEKDLLIIAGMVHDCGKKKRYSSGYKEYSDHPIIGRDLINKAVDDILGLGMDRSDWDTILDYVANHMGPFGPDNMEKEFGSFNMKEYILYYADLLSSNKMIKTPLDECSLSDIPEEVTGE